ncbi:uncharacterized protein E0L32_005603 [Thyridium curvatum]|uniref:Uncharacterized protein n=1 Tax=Thyridium curvatum TaxID=1093900 RepID=A0A507B201_9PEZI|nr:uncharacterized protein E0L32_005603 [Thyridium curvatum]TPX13903.1 hypothetical protein E0L32_005603 [Thyridium curvatum]
MSKPWILVCPSSRGIGHALTRHLLQHTRAPVLATARASSAEQQSSLRDALLRGLPPSARDRLHLARVDVTDEATVRSAAEQAAALFPPGPRGHHLRLALAVPGILRPERAPAQVDAEAALMTYRVNALGPLLLMKHFADFLPRRTTELLPPPEPEPREEEEEGEGGKKKKDLVVLPPRAVWVNMSARVGSVSDDRQGGWYSYRSSKAAVMSLSRSFDHQLRARSGDRAMALSYHPGTVKTDLSKGFWESSAEKYRLLEPEEAAEYMLDVVTRKVGLEGRGKCFDWKGEEIQP